MTFDTCRNPILHRYSHVAPTPRASLSRHSSRSASTSSIADIYYSARNTPSSSRRSSLVAGVGLTMTATGVLTRSKSHGDASPAAGPSRPRTPVEQVVIPGSPTFALSRQVSRASSTGEGALQRIKSLSNFHLYLSPSRLANIDLLSDSDPEEDDDDEGVGDVKIQPVAPRRQLRPVAIDPHQGGIAARRAQRPPLRLLGGIGDEGVRSYSDRLQMHHARILDQYRPIPPLVDALSDQPVPFTGQHEAARAAPPSGPPSPPPPMLVTHDTDRNQDASSAAPTMSDTLQPSDQGQAISAFSSDINPWYGYPAIKSGTEVRPRYNRNRKRDLVKTLLFLFILRIQSWRDAFERWLGLNKLGTWGTSYYTGEDTRDPTAGLMHTRRGSENAGYGVRGQAGGELVKQSAEKDWVWMVITFLLLRGTWTRILAGPLEAVGLVSVRDALGLV